MLLLIFFALAIPLFLLSKWILTKKKIGKKSNRNLLALISSIILSPVVYVGIVLIWMSSVSYYPKQSFQKEKWDTNVEERYKMSKDIINSEILIGKTKEEVIELLGQEYSTYGDNNLTYYLGFVPGVIVIDPDVLDIYFENGKVIRVIQYRT